MDLAIYASDASIKEKKLDILTALVEAGLDRVDLMFIEEDRDIVLAYEAIRQNRLIYSKSDFAGWQSYPGDINYLELLKFKVFPVCIDRGYPEGDLNFDCKCDYLDLSILAEDWLR